MFVCNLCVCCVGIVDGLVCPSRKQSDTTSPLPVKRVSSTFFYHVLSLLFC